jgi:hypothetical protein
MIAFRHSCLRTVRPGVTLMRFAPSPQPFSTACTLVRRRLLWAISVLVLTLLGAVPVAGAASRPVGPDAPHPAQDATPAPKPKSTIHARKRAAAKQAKASTTPSVALASTPPAAPAAPKPPDWPVNDKPTPATITWNASGLRIVAANASLKQILYEVSTLTGLTVDGLGSDERVFGVYGPGPARDVLSRLFDGSVYNMMLIGDQGQGTPRQIILTPRDGKSVAAAPANHSDDDTEDDVEQPDDQQQQPQQMHPPSVRNNFGQQRVQQPDASQSQGPPQ